MLLCAFLAIRQSPMSTFFSSPTYSSYAVERTTQDGKYFTDAILKVRSQHKNVSFYVNQERISKRVHLISNISTHKLFFYTWYPVHLQIMLLRTLSGSFFVEDENARNAAWAVDIKKSAKRSWLCLGAAGISETGSDLSGISLGIIPTRQISTPVLHVFLVLRTLPSR